MLQHYYGKNRQQQKAPYLLIRHNKLIHILGCNSNQGNHALARSETIKVAGIAASAHHSDRVVVKAPPDELFEQLQAVYRSVPHSETGPVAAEALHMLMKSVFDLALSLRSCSAEYDRNQTMPPLYLNEKDIKRTDCYNIGTKGLTGQPMKVLFGPVYKRVNDKRMMLWTGTVL